MAKPVPTRLSPDEGRRFGITIGTAFAGLAVALAWRGHGIPATVSAVLAVTLLLAGLTIPRRLSPVYGAWMKLARILSRVTTPVLMGVTFFFLVTPLGLLMRLFGRNPLVHEARNGSYWRRRLPTDGRGTMKQKF